MGRDRIQQTNRESYHRKTAARVGHRAGCCCGSRCNATRLGHLGSGSASCWIIAGDGCPGWYVTGGRASRSGCSVCRRNEKMEVGDASDMVRLVSASPCWASEYSSMAARLRSDWRRELRRYGMVSGRSKATARPVDLFGGIDQWRRSAETIICGESPSRQFG